MCFGRYLNWTMRSVGTQPFGPLELSTRAPVLIPRPETEHWTIQLSEHVRPSPQNPVRLLDLCTGSGCIPLLLCRLWPRGSVRALGVDIGAEAVQLATENATITGFGVSSEHLASQGAHRPLARNTFRPLLADIRDPAFARIPDLRPPFDVITSNPPYIPKRDYDRLPAEVRQYEDRRALLGDPDPASRDDEHGDGLTFYRAIAQLVARDGLLARHGVLAVEVGKGQAHDVQRILQDHGRLTKTQIWQDPWQVDRAVVATR